MPVLNARLHAHCSTQANDDENELTAAEYTDKEIDCEIGCVTFCNVFVSCRAQIEI